jgi:hypothetical protein
MDGRLHPPDARNTRHRQIRAAVERGEEWGGGAEDGWVCGDE